MSTKAKILIEEISNGKYDAVLKDVYVDEGLVASQRDRYTKAIEEFITLYGDQEVEIYSAPGRSEVGGNHTDHQYGKVLATSVNIDTLAVVSKTEDGLVKLKSEGYDKIQVDLSDLAINTAEFGTTDGLIRGVAAGMKEEGCIVGGFNAYATSQVLSGSGLSSSAAFEVLLGNIFAGLYNDGNMDAVKIAQIGQMAENKYFGKPCGLMDQMACSVGGLIHIDFEDPSKPIVNKIDIDFEDFAHSLCIVDTKGSHADLTDDYAEIPAEMKKAAAYFGVEVLRKVDEEEFYQKLPAVREFAGDRAVLRAIHFFDENKRVDVEKDALLSGDFNAFKETVWESGQSSYKYLQNVYSNHKTQDESVAVALLMSKKILGKDGVCRVHGGGFAGTIQAFVSDAKVPEYKEKIEQIFGEGSCLVLKVRNFGGKKMM